MKNHTHILKWATDYLISKGYFLQRLPEIVLETPWSNVIRFSTSKGDVYLKQPAPSLAQESKITQFLADQCHASVPIVIAANDELHCFLMHDAGKPLREYLKTEFQPDLLCQAILQYTAMQRSTEHHIESLLALGVPDWRLDKLPKLYDHMINQETFLKTEGMTDKELQILHDLSPQISEEIESLSQCQIPETIVQSDFHTNNILINPNTKKLTFIDLGEIVITHPFFSLQTFLRQAITHHGIKEFDQIYHQLQETCCENWLQLTTKKQLFDGFMLAKKLWPIYSALVFYRILHSVDQQSFKSFYANRPNRLAGFFREYVAAKSF
ncbi:Predicted phosphotransferase related to Ser/Thr protein kinases [Legionella steigerwaltii]|uniref:Phosphotransferase enzyme family protein n=1 Tax=Legionella steigerwaltii TaxID=460 RepID=A0A378LDW6_9GAMM|nr:aminoglycoside phosphotransferase family protein [Legionella steigerwaltii]KTD70328.1 Phosphotransferase enzyme family protein [Legionella steigerwaltii]STY24062.1 Predicted phosphotransferase related to Ser/Thr protein kinases [Legionella steigerwaltii]